MSRYKDVAIVYDSDTGRKYVVAQRRFSNPETPVTSLLTAREVTGNLRPPRKKLFEARKVEACFENGSIRSVIVPYVGTDANCKAQASQVKAYAGVLSIRYYGETFVQERKRITVDDYIQ